MRPSNCVDPDHFLDLSGEVELTREDLRAAWDRAYEVTQQKLRAAETPVLYVVFGLQGAGKTTWVESNAHRLGPNAVLLSGPLPSRKQRERAVAVAKAIGARSVAVWINTPFEVCMSRIAERSGLARVREEAVRHVQERLEPPSTQEGFNEVIEVQHAPAVA
jgi:predicted kinase